MNVVVLLDEFLFAANFHLFIVVVVVVVIYLILIVIIIFIIENSTSSIHTSSLLPRSLLRLRPFSLQPTLPLQGPLPVQPPHRSGVITAHDGLLRRGQQTEEYPRRLPEGVEQLLHGDLDRTSLHHETERGRQEQERPGEGVATAEVPEEEEEDGVARRVRPVLYL